MRTPASDTTPDFGRRGIAQLRNVALFAEALENAVRRPQHLPGLVVMHGFSGFGKSRAATFGANIHRAYYIEVRSRWTAAGLCEAILQEMGVDATGRVYRMIDRIAQQLAQENRPLIIDEADFLLKRGMAEIVRDIHEASGCVVALIGEERLPAKLRAEERIHNRVGFWVAAEPCDLEDAQALASLYVPQLAIAEDLLARAVTETAGCTRRVVTALHSISLAAKQRPAKELDAAWWGREPLVPREIEPRSAFAARGRAA